jgi:hypothetical protein
MTEDCGFHGFTGSLLVIFGHVCHELAHHAIFLLAYDLLVTADDEAFKVSIVAFLVLIEVLFVNIFFVVVIIFVLRA